MTGVDYASNPNQRTPCVLVLDTSGSMENMTSSGRTRIQELNLGLRAFHASLQEDPAALTRVQVGIITIGGPSDDASVLMDWTDANMFEPFDLVADHTTPLGEGMRLALAMVEQSKQNLRNAGISYTRPWIMVITDGDPTDDDATWRAAVQECQAAENGRKAEIFMIGVEDANLSMMSQLAKRPPLMLEGMKFKELFVWLSASLSAASRSRPGDNVQMANTDPWRNVGV